MSRSYKKKPYESCDAGQLKEWKKQINSAYRTRCKQLIHTTNDWDSFLLPNPKNGRDRWEYPKEGRRWWVESPRYNQCELEAVKYGWRSRFSGYRLNPDGHHTYCNCYTNKKSKYWKMMRK